jgi:sugar lactone lactonase YvrE
VIYTEASGPDARRSYLAFGNMLRHPQGRKLSLAECPRWTSSCCFHLLIASGLQLLHRPPLQSDR